MNIQKHPSLKKTPGLYVGVLHNFQNNWSGQSTNVRVQIVTLKELAWKIK